MDKPKYKTVTSPNGVTGKYPIDTPKTTEGNQLWKTAIANIEPPVFKDADIFFAYGLYKIIIGARKTSKPAIEKLYKNPHLYTQTVLPFCLGVTDYGLLDLVHFLSNNGGSITHQFVDEKCVFVLCFHDRGQMLSFIQLYNDGVFHKDVQYSSGEKRDRK